jgi:hypothetical protein
MMSPTTVNSTGTVDRDLLKRLKILAAKLATSINALLNAELRHLVDLRGRRSSLPCVPLSDGYGNLPCRIPITASS